LSLQIIFESQVLVHCVQFYVQLRLRFLMHLCILRMRSLIWQKCHPSHNFFRRNRICNNVRNYVNDTNHILKNAIILLFDNFFLLFFSVFLAHLNQDAFFTSICLFLISIYDAFRMIYVLTFVNFNKFIALFYVCFTFDALFANRQSLNFQKINFFELFY
jgi:hypothetical protein